MVSELWWVVNWKRVGQMGKEKWWVNCDGWWTERVWGRWEKRNGEWIVMGGELKESGTDGKREVVSELWWVVNWKRVGQMGEEKCWVNCDGCWTEREWDRWEKRNGEWMVDCGELKESERNETREMVSEWWWVVSWRTAGQMWHEKWWVNGGGWWAERDWGLWDNRNGE